MIIGIVCVDKNWGIGNKGDLLFKIKEDQKFFKTMTMGHPVVMGLTTFQSIGSPLPGRLNIVLCPEGTEIPGVITLNSIDAVLSQIEQHPDEDYYIIGGASIYAQFLDYMNAVYITKVNDIKEADTYFPNLDEDKQFTKIGLLKSLTEDANVYVYEKKTNPRPSWDRYFMNIAEDTARMSKDNHTQVGAVFVSKERRILSTGYNGAPRNFNDGMVPACRDTSAPLYLQKYPYIIHAELNAVLNYRGNLSDFEGSTLYVTTSPCYECAKVIMQLGVKEVVYKDLYNNTDVTEMTDILFNRCNPKIIMRQLKGE